MIILSFLLLTACVQKAAAPAENKAERKETPEESRKKAVAVVKHDPALFQLSGNIKIVAIGDSLTKGFGDKKKEGYVGRVRALLEKRENISKVSVVNLAVVGDTTTNLLKTLHKEEVLTELKDADLIMMSIGANDLMKVVQENIFQLTLEPFRSEQQNYENRMRDILNIIRSTNKKALIAVIGLYNPFAEGLPDFPEIDTIISEWNEGTKNILAEDGGAIFVPVQDVFQKQGGPDLLYKDDFHPNETGYTMIAEKVFETLENVSAKE